MRSSGRATDSRAGFVCCLSHRGKLMPKPWCADCGSLGIRTHIIAEYPHSVGLDGDVPRKNTAPATFPTEMATSTRRTQQKNPPIPQGIRLMECREPHSGKPEMTRSTSPSITVSRKKPPSAPAASHGPCWTNVAQSAHDKAPHAAPRTEAQSSCFMAWTADRRVELMGGRHGCPDGWHAVLAVIEWHRQGVQSFSA